MENIMAQTVPVVGTQMDVAHPLLAALVTHPVILVVEVIVVARLVVVDVVQIKSI